MTNIIFKGSSTGEVPRLLTDSATGQTGVTGLTGAAVGTPVTLVAGVAGSITITVYKPGGTGFVNGAGTVTELGLGNYLYKPSATETASAGTITTHWVATGCGTQDTVAQVVAFDPNDAVRLGLTSLPNVAAGASGGLPTGNASGQVTVVSNLDKTGYTASTVSDKTGYSGTATNLPSDYQQRAVAVTLPVTAPTGFLATDTTATGIKSQTDKLTFTGGNVNSASQNLPSDYQQRAVAVTLPANAPSTFSANDTVPLAIKAKTDQLTFTGSNVNATGGSGSGGATAAEVAAAILANPSNKLVTDSNGQVGVNNLSTGGTSTPYVTDPALNAAVQSSGSSTVTILKDDFFVFAGVQYTYFKGQVVSVKDPIKAILQYSGTVATP